MLIKDQMPQLDDQGSDAGASPEGQAGPASDDDASQSSLDPVDEISHRLESLLDDVNQKAMGTFAYAKMLPDAPNPGLAIRDYGLVGLPLSNSAAASLTRLAGQAPFGKGSETLIDTSVRNTWEIDASSITMESPRWTSYLNDLVKDIATKLGVDGSVQAQLYKLLIYEEGGFFRTHRDSEKAVGMFATLVIALPSEHTGGDVVVSFQGKQKVLQTASSSRLDFSCLAWYADVEHEVCKVTSGYRIALTYNLCHDTDPAESHTAKSLGDSNLPLQEFFRYWEGHAAENSPHYLAYVLDHLYTDANLQMSQLKGCDRLKGQALVDASRVSNMTVLLANMKKTLSGTCEVCDSERDFQNCVHWYEEVNAKSCRFSLLVEADGSIFGRQYPFNEKLILPYGTLEGDPDTSDCEGFLGNQAGEATHTFQRTCFIIMRTPEKLKFMFDGVFATRNYEWLDAWVESEDHSEAQLRQICHWMIRRQPFEKRLGSYLPWRIIKTACTLRSYNLFNTASIFADADVYFPAVPAIGRMVVVEFEDWKAGLFELLRKRRVFHKTYEMSQSILEAAKEYSLAAAAGNPDVLEAYLNQTLPSIFATINGKNEHDGGALVQLAIRNESQYIFRSILPVIKAEISNIFVITGFLNRLGKAYDREEIDRAIAMNVFRDVVFNFASDVRLQTKGRPFNGANLATLVSYCLKFNFHSEAIQLLRSIVAAALHTQVEVYRLSIVPFIANFSPLLGEPNDTTSDGYGAFRDAIATFTKQMLNAYRSAILPKKLTPPTGWKQDVLKCRCEQCRSLDAFFLDATEESTEIQVQSYFELEYQLGRDFVHCERISSEVGTSGSPQCTTPRTLKVTKRADRYDMLMEKRQGTVRDAVRNLLVSLNEIGVETLQALLGSDQFTLPLDSCPWVKEAEAS